MELVLDSSLHVPHPVAPEITRAFTYRINGNDETAIIQDQQHIRFPRGNLQKLHQYFGHHQILDQRVEAPLDIPFALTTELWPDQKSWLEQWYQSSFGGLEAPGGSGKTVVSLGMLARLQQKAIVLVGSNYLAQQWDYMFRKHTDIRDKDLSVVTPGRRKLAPITIATWQSLIPRGDKPNALLEQAQKYFGVTFVDESHREAAPCFQQVAQSLHSRRRLHVTATPYRKDKLEPLLFDVMGPIQVQGEPRLVPARITFPRTSTEVYFGQWTRMINILCAHQERNAQIAQQIYQDALQGHRVLVLSDRRGHCLEFQRLLEPMGLRVQVFMGGSIRKSLIDRTLKQLEDQSLQVIIGTKVMDEGVDFPPLSCLHLTCPGNNRGTLAQRVWRICREYPEKPRPLVRDWIDRYDRPLVCCQKNRIKWYSELGHALEF